MKDLSILIGGKAGFGIDKGSSMIASLLSRLGYRIYIYRDYPSLIRGGHTFTIIRASENKVAAHSDKVDVLLALNQDAINLHKARLKENALVIYDSDSVKSEGTGIALGKILKEENATEIARNTAIIGAFCKAVGIEWKILEDTVKKYIPKEADINLKVALRAYNEAKPALKIVALKQPLLPFFTGNESASLGLVKAGLDTYISYPMTPTSPMLHFLAAQAERFGIKVIHPESEISVMLMATGAAYCGEKVAVGSSGGGFCLMTEGLSFSAMAELPVVIVLGQRPGPSTGLPTYSCQTELHFALHAGQGEFARFMVAPGDAEECYYWAQVALNMSGKYQLPSIILTDKTLAEGTFSFDMNLAKPLPVQDPVLWDRKTPYKRYLNTDSGISPLALVPDKDATIKANSYEHDESGITTEDAALTKTMQDKRLRKGVHLAKELEEYETVKVYGNANSDTVILCWGSNKGVSVEVASKMGLKVVQPIVLEPFPLNRFKETLKGVKKLIAVENNATGQLASLINGLGLKVDAKILKYDGRPFSLEELEELLKGALR
jgi:2-oxoglutarate ferredoxin oxidoreductase subunit alpha